jgi:hypothetical protein
MSKDDYYVIVYRLLTYYYGCLKNGTPPTAAALTAKKYGIGAGYWDFIKTALFQGGLLSGGREAESAGGVDKR